jgi:hypothetical protein
MTFRKVGGLDSKLLALSVQRFWRCSHLRISNCCHIWLNFGMCQYVMIVLLLCHRLVAWHATWQSIQALMLIAYFSRRTYVAVRQYTRRSKQWPRRLQSCSCSTHVSVSQLHAVGCSWYTPYRCVLKVFVTLLKRSVSHSCVLFSSYMLLP